MRDPLILPLFAVVCGILLGRGVSFSRFEAAWPWVAFLVLAALTAKRAAPLDPLTLPEGAVKAITNYEKLRAAENAISGAAMRPLDVYTPQGAAGLPVVVYVHGGGWSRSLRIIPDVDPT